jgi:hypothetical protein
MAIDQMWKYTILIILLYFWLHTQKQIQENGVFSNFFPYLFMAIENL